jgi:hypothetical protein
LRVRVTGGSGISADTAFSQSLFVNVSTATLFASSSHFAETASAAVFAATASLLAAGGSIESASFAVNATNAVSASFSATSSAATSLTFTPATASYAIVAQSVLNSPVSSSFATSASYAKSASAATSITFTPTSASFAQSTLTSNTSTSSSFATSASAATSITFTPTSASFAPTDWSVINNKPTVVSSSGQINYTGLSGTPSGIVSSSSQVNTGSFTGSFIGGGSQLTGVVSASFSTTASAATTITFTPATSSYALTASFAANAGGNVSASYAVTASAATSLTFTPVTASYALTAGTTGGGLTGQGIAGRIGKFDSVSSITSSVISEQSSTIQISGSTAVTGTLVVSSVVSASAFSGSGTNITGVISSSFASTASAATSITFLPATSSFAQNALTANSATSSSYALTASFAANAGVPVSASFATTSSAATSITFTPTTASFATEVLKSTGGFTVTGSLKLSGSVDDTGYQVTASFFKGDGSQVTGIISSSYALTASYAANAGVPVSASFATTASAATSITFIPASASFATTASAATSITFTPTTASYALTAGTTGGGLTGQGIAGKIAKFDSVSTVTSSIISEQNSTVQISGSTAITGTLTVSNAISASAFSGSGANITGVVSSSFAATSSAATSLTFVPATASFATEVLKSTGGFTVTGSLKVSGNIDNTGYQHTASFYKGDGSLVTGVVSSSYAVTSSYASVAQNVLGSITSASFATSAYTASYISGNINFPNGLIVTGSVSASGGGFSGSGVNVTGVISSSYALTASFALNGGGSGVSASFATFAYTASYFTGTVGFPNGLVVTGSVTASAFSGSHIGTHINSLKTVFTTYTSSILDSYIVGDTRSGSFTVLLPDAALQPGYVVTIFKPFLTASIIVQASGSQTINSVVSWPLNAASASISVFSSGSQWNILTAYTSSFAISSSAATSITFTPATASYALTAGATGGGLTGQGIAGRIVKFDSVSSVTSSIITEQNSTIQISGSSAITGTLSVSSAISASTLSGSGANITGVVSSSFATTSSAATSITFTPASASFATTASAATSITFTPATASFALQVNKATGSFSGTFVGLVGESIKQVTGSYTSSVLDGYLFGDTRSGSFTILLPDASTLSGYALTIIKPFASASLTVQASGSQTINSVTSWPLTDASSSILVIGSGSQWSILNSFSSSFAQTAATASYLSGGIEFPNGLIVTGSVTASVGFKGDGSQVTGVISSSYALTASYAANGGGSGVSSSYALTASYATVAQNVLGSITSASYALTSSYATIAQNVLGSITSASYASTASFAQTAVTASYFTGTVDFPNGLIITGSVTASIGFSGSHVGTFTNSIKTISTLYTSSILDSYLIGDTRSGSFTILLPDASSGFGYNLTVFKPFATASITLQASGSQTIDSSTSWILSPASSSIQLFSSGSQWNILIPLSSSNAVTSSYAVVAQNVLGSITSASYALTSSYSTVAQNVLGSITSASFATSAYTASYFTGTVGFPNGLVVTGSISASTGFSGSGVNVTGVVSSSYSVTSSYALTAQNVLGSITSASYALTASAATSLTFIPATSSFATEVLKSTGGFTVTGALSVSGNINDTGYQITASFFKGDGSQVTGVVSSSYALTASYAANGGNPVSSSYALTSSAATSITFVPATASFATEVLKSTGGFTVTGSLKVSGNIDNTGYQHTASFYKGDGSQVTGVVSSSYSVTSSYALVAQSVLGAITSASYATTASFAQTAVTASYLTGTINFANGLIVTGSITGTVGFIISESYGPNYGQTSSSNTPVTTSFTDTGLTLSGMGLSATYQLLMSFNPYSASTNHTAVHHGYIYVSTNMIGTEQSTVQYLSLFRAGSGSNYVSSSVDVVFVSASVEMESAPSMSADHQLRIKYTNVNATNVNQKTRLVRIL